MRAAATKDGKNGVLVSLFINDEKMLDFFDDNPLPGYNDGGRVAFWTLDSTMMIARARIEAAHLGTRALPQGLIEAAYNSDQAAPLKNGELAPLPVMETGVKTAVVEPDKTGWTITNPVSGGIFAVDLNGVSMAATARDQVQHGRPNSCRCEN